MTSKQETKYQDRLMSTLYELFPNCFIIKNNPDEIQGIPDLLILYKRCWAMLEVKANANARIQPNQIWYIEKFNSMSFGAFIYPEIEEEVLRALQSSFGDIR